MLNWILPGAFWFGLALLPVAFFYFLRMRFRRQPIASTYLWERLRRTTGGASRLRRRSILLFVLQAAVVMTAVWALAGPIWNQRRLEKPGTLFLIDDSASMASSDEQPDRLTRACKLVENEIRRLPRGGQGMIMLCAADALPLGKPTENHGRLIASLQRIKASGEDFNEASVAETVRTWLERQGKPWKACLVTDGGLTMGGRRINAVFNGTLKTLYLGKNGHNLGLNGLRLDENGTKLTVVNGWPTRRIVWIRFDKNGKLLFRKAIQVPPGVSLQKLDSALISGKPGLYSAQIEKPSDFFPADDRVYLAVNQPRRFRVLLATDNNPFLQAVFDNPGIELSQSRDIPSGTDGTGWDLTIADHVPIPRDFRGNLLTFGVIPPQSPLRPGKLLHGILTSADSAHPLLRFVDWQGTRVTGGRGFQTGGGVQVLATVKREPAIVAWEENGRRIVACGTDFWLSDLGLSGSFPIFLQNMLRWCVPQADNSLAYTLTTGHPALFAEPSTLQLNEAQAFRMDRQNGIYQITALSPGFARWRSGNRQGFLAANLPFTELNIAPTTLAYEDYSRRAEVGYSNRRFALAPVCLLLLLLLLSAEWMIWRGGWRFRKDGR